MKPKYKGSQTKDQLKIRFFDLKRLNNASRNNKKWQNFEVFSMFSEFVKGLEIKRNGDQNLPRFKRHNFVSSSLFYWFYPS